jgi:hypothetical protein
MRLSYIYVQSRRTLSIGGKFDNRYRGTTNQCQVHSKFFINVTNFVLLCLVWSIVRYVGIVVFIVIYAKMNIFCIQFQESGKCSSLTPAPRNSLGSAE